MSKLTPELVADINKDTVDMVDNYDATTFEPTVLPTRIPNLLLNGADGIAVGMATRIPPHNLKELCQALDHIITHSTLETVENPNATPSPQPTSTTDIVLQPVSDLARLTFNFETSATVEELTQFVSGPDFPTSGEIYGKTGIIEMYTTGRGKFTLRGKTSIEETKSGKVRIVITEIPYQVNKAEFVKKIADLVRDKKIIGISDLRDESDRHGIRVVVEIKKNGKPKSILNKLFKYTPLQSSYSANMLALVNGVPQTLNLRQMLLYFLRHRESVIRRRSIFDLKTAYMRAHILEGLKKALDIIDQVIATIRASKNSDDAREALISKFEFTDLQANAILEMQLRRLAALERQKIDDEYQEVEKTIQELTDIVTKPEAMIKVLQTENAEIIEKYADGRKTKIYVRGLEDFSEEDLIPNESAVVTITRTGYIKRVPKDTFKSQQRGGKGVVAMTTKQEDEIDNLLSVNTHDDLLFFTNKGRVFKTKVWDLQEASRQSKGQAIVNLINISQGEIVQTILPIKKDNGAKYIVLATRNGTIKKTDLSQFKNIRQTGLTAIKLDPGDELVWARLTSGSDQIFLVSFEGKCIRFNETDARPMGRHTRGVRGILLKDKDQLVSMDIVPSSLKQEADKSAFRHLLVVTQKGIGKRSDVYLYPIQKRGGVGVKASAINSKTGHIVAAQVVCQDHNQVILISKKGISIRLPLKNIPVLNRNTQGVILMRFKSDDTIGALTVLEEADTTAEAK
jgi:DNA gyrase subunit A